MNSRNAQIWPQRQRSRFRPLIASAVTAACLVGAGAGVSGAHAAGVSLANDIAPPTLLGPSTLLGAQQGTLLAPPAPIFGPGFSTLDVPDGMRPQTRKTYTLRLVGAWAESMRGPAEFAAAQVAAISGVTITVAPGIIADTVPDREPARGEILLSVDGSSPCNDYAPDWVGCGGPRGWEVWAGTMKLHAGRIWIHPSVRNYIVTGEKRTVVSHELGHALGLGHRDAYYHGEFQVMSSEAAFDTRGYYREGDENGLQFTRPVENQFEVQNSIATGPPEVSFPYGNPGDIPLKGDWDGNGTDTHGVYRPSTATFYLQNGPSVPAVMFVYGNPGDTPVTGDWNGDGIDTVGVRRGLTWHLRSGGPGIPEVSFSYGDPSDIPLTGDWDGNGTDTHGVYRPGTATFYLQNGPSVPAVTFVYGNPGDTPVTGDWNADGTDTIGVRRGEMWHLRNHNSPGTGDWSAQFGEAQDKPLPGDWDGNNSDTLGVYR